MLIPMTLRLVSSKAGNATHTRVVKLSGMSEIINLHRLVIPMVHI
jgi:hypothetical protein